MMFKLVCNLSKQGHGKETMVLILEYESTRARHHHIRELFVFKFPIVKIDPGKDSEL